MDEGATIGLDLRALMAAVREKPRDGWGEKLGSTPVDSLVVRFASTTGVLKAETVTADDSTTHFSAEGSISLPNRTVDLRLNAVDRLKQDLLTREGGETIDIRGSWASPSIRPAGRSSKAAEPGEHDVPPAPADSRG
jgi:hypothetical protein